ncbi:MAG: AMP-binding protein, partial [Pseudomonadota bacterium]
MQDDNHLITALRRASLGREDAVFATRPGKAPVTYGELWDGAARAAAALSRAGVRAGDRVAVQVEKSLAALEIYLGTVMAGGVFLPLNPAYTPAEMAYFLEDAEPAVFVCDPARAAALGAESGPAAVFTLDGAGRGSWAPAATAEAPVAAPLPRGPDDLAAILYTSGTTGRSKGAMLTHRNLSSNAEVLARAWAFTEGDHLIHALPIFHSHGLFVATNVTLVAGSSVHFLPGFDADAIFDAMPAATAMMGVPTFYTRLLADPRLERAAVAHVRLFVSGSAPLLAETHRAWEARTGHRILERYGMTETNMNASNPYDGERRPGSVGPPLPGTEIIVTDPETGAEVPVGETGMVEVRGPNVFTGYWRMPGKTAEELRRNGFFITGDLGRIDADGYLTIVGRAKDLIISGGFNVYPKEVEEALDDLPEVTESAVVGVPHPDFGEAVVAVIVPAGAAPEEAAVKAALTDRLAKFKQPKRVIAVAALPRNAMGKV